MQSSTSVTASKRWFHSGVYYKGHLVFLAGNTHTDTVFSTGTLCFSNEMMVYSLDCKKWKKSTVPDWYARYGSSSVVFEEKVVSVGGFNGEMLSDKVEIQLADGFLRFDGCAGNEAPNDLMCPTSKTGSLGAQCSQCVNKHNFFEFDQKCRFCSSKCSSNCPRTSSHSYCDPEDELEYSCYSDRTVKCSSCVLSGCKYEMTTYPVC